MVDQRTMDKIPYQLDFCVSLELFPFSSGKKNFKIAYITADALQKFAFRLFFHNFTVELSLFIDFAIENQGPIGFGSFSS